MPKYQPKNGELNPYIPRYILETPRYQQDIINKSPEQEDAQDQTTTAHDPLAHQRKTGEIIDNSIAQSGAGIKDEFKGTIRVEENESYDSKRDRWYGYSTEEWLTHLKNWNDKKQSRKHASAQDNDDSDDTDYELELIELELDKKDMKKNIKKDPMEKMLRDRQDIPAYIYNITSNPNNKIRIEYDPKSRLAKDSAKGFLNKRNQFVKKLTGDGDELMKLQKMAQELDNEHEKDRKLAKLKQEFYGEENPKTIPQTDLSLSLEASPTLMMLKSKQLQNEKLAKSIQSKQEVMEKYNASTESDEKELKKTGHLEDKLFLNHKYIYGSYYENGKWGYKCCKQFDKNSRCTATD